MRYMRLGATAGLTASFLAVTSLAVGRTPEDASGAPPGTGVRDCRSRGEAGAPIRMRVTDSDVRIGPLVMVGVRRRSAAGSTGRSDWPFVRKAPVLLPARARVVLAIAPEARTRAAFQHRGGWTTAVRFTACFERVRAWSYRGTVGRTTFFPFAVAVQQRAACVPMALWVDGDSSPVRRLVPIGRRSCLSAVAK